MSADRVPLAARYLELVVRLLPKARHEWGQAMRAELASISDPAGRWQFVAGCTRVAVVQTVRGHLWLRILAAVAVLFAMFGLAGLIGDTVPLVLTLILLAWLGSRPSAFGPVRPSGPARSVRFGAFGLVGLLVVLAVRHEGLANIVSPKRDWLPSAIALIVYLGVFLAGTARAARIGDTALAIGAGTGLLAGGAAFVAMPFARSKPPIASFLPGYGPSWGVAPFVVIAVAALVTGGLTRKADQGVLAAVTAGTLAPLIAGALGVGAIVLFPSRLSQQPGQQMVPGSTPAARQAENAIFAIDPYAGLIVFGALLALVLLVLARPTSWSWSRAGLLIVFSLPPLALTQASGTFVGSALIRVTTVAVLAAALLVTVLTPRGRGPAAPGDFIPL